MNVYTIITPGRVFTISNVVVVASTAPVSLSPSCFSRALALPSAGYSAITIAIVAVVAKLLVPGMPWAAAVAQVD